MFFIFALFVYSAFKGPFFKMFIETNKNENKNNTIGASLCDTLPYLVSNSGKDIGASARPVTVSLLAGVLVDLVWGGGDVGRPSSST